MKARSDSHLKNLSEELQSQIIEWSNTPKSKDCPGSYEYAKAQLAAIGIKVSREALSNFWSWWHSSRISTQGELTRDFKLRKSRCDAVLKNLPKGRQKQIIDWCHTPKTTKSAGGYDYARQQLAASGIKVSQKMLSHFLDLVAFAAQFGDRRFPSKIAPIFSPPNQ